jgi:hypothetical protein
MSATAQKHAPAALDGQYHVGCDEDPESEGQEPGVAHAI